MKRMLPSSSQLFFSIIGLLGIWGACSLLDPINERRAEYQITNNDVMENSPPELVMATTALGGFRGLVIDYLWLRSIKLKNEGKHYEIVQLYDWLGKLEPRIPKIWAFTAWEMAYNISVTMPTPEERWRWVEKGIEHLRDGGIQYNPNNHKLYWELSWLYINKISIVQSVDQYRFYYQNELYDQIAPILGQRQDIRRLAEAPATREELLQNASARSLIDTLQQQNVDIFRDFFRLHLLPQERQQQFVSIFQDPEHREGATVLSAYLRADYLRTKFKMDPQKMLAIEEKYTSLNWVLASSHALYWAEQGRECLAKNPAQKNSFDEQNMDRIRRIALRENFEYGYVLDKGKLRLICLPNFAILDKTYQAFAEIEQKWGPEKGLPSHQDFLENVVWQCYVYDLPEQARHYYKILQDKFSDRYQQPLEEYVAEGISKKIMGMGRRHIIEDYIIGILWRYYLALTRVRKSNQKAAKLYQTAQKFHAKYVELHGNLEDTIEQDRPRDFQTFVKASFLLFKERYIARYGQEGWDKLVAQNPSFAKGP